MRVCLVYPSNWETGGPKKMGLWPPLGLAYIAAVLEQNGHSVMILDRCAQVKRYYDKDRKTRELLRSFRPDLVGVTATTPFFPDACRSAELAKEFGDVPVVIGGPHASALAEDVLRGCPHIDIVCLGEGEMVMTELTAGRDVAEIQGIVYRRNGEIRHNPPRPRIEHLDDLPLPARHLVDMDLYTRPSYDVVRGMKLKATHLFTARGCPFKCTFCAGSSVYGHGVRFHSVDRVVAEVEHLISTYRVDGLYFAEDMFLFHKTRALEICARFIAAGIHKKVIWCAQSHVSAVDEELMRKMKQAGCAQVEFGFESGSQRVLDLMKKKSTVEQNYRAAELARKVGIRFLGNFILGMPGETREDFEQTIKFIFDIQPDVLGTYRFVPLPGSEIYNDLKQKGMLYDDWTAYTVGNKLRAKGLNLTTMTDEEFYGLFDAFREQYFKGEHRKHPLRNKLLRLANDAHLAVRDPGFLFRKLRAKIF